MKKLRNGRKTQEKIFLNKKWTRKKLGNERRKVEEKIKEKDESKKKKKIKKRESRRRIEKESE